MKINRTKRPGFRLLSLTAAVALGSLAWAAPRAALADDIVDTAVKAGKFTTLITAVKAAGLVEALKGPGPLTVFAPTDAAFAKIPKATLASLLKPENKAKLAAILKYHVVPGAVKAADVLKLPNGARVATLEGSKITIHNKGGVRVNNARVTQTDITADNGVIHVIDTVLMPPAPKKHSM